MSVNTLFLDGDNKQLRDAIFKATPKSIEQCRTIAQKFKGKNDFESCQNIWNFLKKDITYVVDGEHQKIKLPSALLRERTGDCKSYSLFTAGILGNLGIPFKYCLTSYTSDPTPAHIYVKCDNGIIIDGVWTAFNEEKKPIHIYYQKPNMKISYIAGIDTASNKFRPIAIGSMSYRSKGLKGFPIGAYRKPFGYQKTFMGIGRTGIDWLKAATGREATFGEQTEYWAKNVALLSARLLLEKFIANNGGGIANFMYNAWLRTEPYYLPNQKKWDEEYNLGLTAIDKQYPLPYKTFPFTAAETAALNSSYTPSSGGALNVMTKVQTVAAKSVSQVLSTQRLAEYNKFQSLLSLRQEATKKLTAVLDEKYPLKTRVIQPSTAKSQAKYRDFELMWFWKLGGSPDDLNNAVKEGNTKSPRGKDANYMINKAFNKNLSVKDIGLIIRAFTSAFAGDKFGLGEDGTFVVGIGCVDFTTCMAVVSANIGPITESVLGIATILSSFGIDITDLNGEKAKAEKEKQDKLAAEELERQKQQEKNNGKKEGSDNTLLIVGGVALVGAYFLLKK